MEDMPLSAAKIEDICFDAEHPLAKVLSSIFLYLPQPSYIFSKIIFIYLLLSTRQAKLAKLKLFI
jgi:hypothetical protein